MANLCAILRDGITRRWRCCDSLSDVNEANEERHDRPEFHIDELRGCRGVNETGLDVSRQVFHTELHAAAISIIA